MPSSFDYWLVGLLDEMPDCERRLFRALRYGVVQHGDLMRSKIYFGR